MVMMKKLVMTMKMMMMIVRDLLKMKRERKKQRYFCFLGNVNDVGPHSYILLIL